MASPNQKPAKRGQNNRGTDRGPFRTAEQRAAFAAALKVQYDTWLQANPDLNAPRATIAFVNSMNVAAADLQIKKTFPDERILTAALSGTVPQWDTFRCMLRALCPGVTNENGDEEEHPASKPLTKLWRGENAGDPAVASGMEKAPPVPRTFERAGDWDILGGGHDFDGLLEFRLHQPEKVNFPADSYGLKATLKFFIATPIFEKRQYTMSLNTAVLTVSATGYQVAEGNMIGSNPDSLLTHFHAGDVYGGCNITGLGGAGGLNGNALPGGEHLAVVEPLANKRDTVTVRIAAPVNEFTVTPSGSVIGSAKARRLKHKLLKALVLEQCHPDVLGRLILAERRIKRKKPGA